MKIAKDTVFRLQSKRVLATRDILISEGESGCFILNFWEQCSHSDINVFPVVFVKCESERELYVLKKNNIILGSEKDICLT
ncbi:MAG: hypothetical protein E7283_02405 [Lachnospiraceae bacterium]|nr:hypothetical protein [Lachnospiraceae bacterium]